jgi:ribosomal-protein-alanine acetyltransferase
MSYRPVKLLQKYVLRPVPSTKVSVPSQTAPPPPVMPETLIVAATKADVPAAVELEQACFDSHRISKRQLQYLSTRKSAVFLVARQGERLVGQGIALIRQHKRGLSGRIYSICVRSECRGQKIGQRLLREMIAQLTQRGVKRIYLEVDVSNTHARMLYERNGFRSIGKLPDYYGEGKHGLHMMFAVPVPLPVAVS